MSISPLSPLSRSAAVPSSRPALRRGPQRRMRAWAAASAALLATTAAQAGDAPGRAAGGADAAPAVDAREAAPAETGKVGEILTGLFARFDEALRSLSDASDRAARRALEGEVGQVAAGQDRQMTARARSALAGAPDAARRYYAGTPERTRPVRVVYVYARMDGVPPAAPAAGDEAR